MTLQQLLGIQLPIIQAPMAGVQDHRLAVAVSNAGGLGSLPAAMLSLDALRSELTALQAQTSKPFNVNFFCHTPPQPDAARDARWRAALAPYYAELDLDPALISAGPSRAPFSAAAAELLAAFRPAVLSFHFGLPSPELLAQVRRWDCKVIASATTVVEALWLESQGVDAIIAQGLEAGGHRGNFLSTDLTEQTGTFALLPRIAQTVRVPVIAAGGIADAQGVAAAMALGAVGVQVGSAYLLCPEATTSAIHRAALQSPAAGHTALTTLFSGRPARGIVNRVMRELGPLSAPTPQFPLATSAIAPLRAKAESLGRGDFSPLWCGQNASGCKAIGAADLTLELSASL
jgi:nitronate monooxygenase